MTFFTILEINFRTSFCQPEKNGKFRFPIIIIKLLNTLIIIITNYIPRIRNNDYQSI